MGLHDQQQRSSNSHSVLCLWRGTSNLLSNKISRARIWNCAGWTASHEASKMDLSQHWSHRRVCITCQQRQQALQSTQDWISQKQSQESKQWFPQSQWLQQELNELHTATTHGSTTVQDSLQDDTQDNDKQLTYLTNNVQHRLTSLKITDEH